MNELRVLGAMRGSFTCILLCAFALEMHLQGVWNRRCCLVNHDQQRSFGVRQGVNRPVNIRVNARSTRRI